MGRFLGTSDSQLAQRDKEFLTARREGRATDQAYKLALQNNAGAIDQVRQNTVNNTGIATTDMTNRTSLATTGLNNATDMAKQKLVNKNNLAVADRRILGDLAVTGQQGENQLAVQGAQDTSAAARLATVGTQAAVGRNQTAAYDLMKTGSITGDQAAILGAGSDNGNGMMTQNIDVQPPAQKSLGFDFIAPKLDDTGKPVTQGGVLNRDSGTVSPATENSPNEAMAHHTAALEGLDPQHRATYMQALRVADPVGYRALMTQLQQVAK